MLVAVNKRLEARAPGAEAPMSWDMSKKDGLLALRLHIFENRFEPSELVTRICQNFPEIPVLFIACLSCYTKYSSVIESLFVSSALKLKVLEVVAGLSKGLDSLIVKPVVPHS